MKPILKDYFKLTEAKEIIRSVKGHPMPLEKRAKLAVELAALILNCSYYYQTKEESKQQKDLAKLMADPIGKIFTTAFADQSFRPKSLARIANQMIYLLDYFGIPKFMSFPKRLQLQAFKSTGASMPQILVPLAMQAIRKETSKVIIPGEKKALISHIKKRNDEDIRLNLNHLGEAILGEDEATARLDVYLKDLKIARINYVSIKISTIYSQINPISWDNTIEKVAIKLRKLYRTAMKNPCSIDGGKPEPKFVNLDMEEYKDLHLTKEVFKKVLSEDEFKDLSAGIVLQAYIPDSHLIQVELTEWAMKRVENGGAPIKIRIVKGANLAMEQFEASLKGWPQAPYTSKMESDANYKRMVNYAFIPEHAKCVHIGVGSHNLFDISYALILASENEVEDYIIFEMLEGMADHVRRVVHELSGKVLLYCAVATKEDFQSAIAYLIRRLDENTGPENFLRHMFNLKTGSDMWDAQANFFIEGVKDIETCPLGARKTQNRFDQVTEVDINDPFENEPDTDFSLPSNVTWAHEIINNYKSRKYDPIPLVIGGKEIHEETPSGKGFDPSIPGEELYTYSNATETQVDEILGFAKSAEKRWSETSVDERCKIMAKFAHLLRARRAHMQGILMADGGKTIIEADIEYSEAVDFAEYYIRSMLRWSSFKDLDFKPKGTVLVTPPWNFPVSIPAGGVITALITGNCVVFKPAPEAVLSGYETAKLLWEAGVPKDVLQFMSCEDDPVGSNLIKDFRVDSVILTGATSTAKLFLKMKPGLQLSAETGGKNALIITAASDRDLAIKDLVASSFGHNGQKCSCASLAILEKEVYEDKTFLRQLKDAAASLKVGSAWDPQNKVSPLIRAPGEDLMKGLTTLDPGESWLLKPRQDPTNPCLWSPGIKLGVKKGSYSHQTEFFGPLLSIIKANDLEHAIEIANGTPYGLTSGIHSLDEREIQRWEQAIVAGNCYINRTITGAVVQRQPFGGTKKSCFGNGSKAGGPNYLLQFMHINQAGLPKEKAPVNDFVNKLSTFLEKFDLTAEELGTWYASIANYAFWWQRLRKDYDPTKVVGQDNIFRYVKRKKVVIRLHPEDHPLDYLRLFAAALTTQTMVEISWNQKGKEFPPSANWSLLLPIFNIKNETEEDFIHRVTTGGVKRVRMISKPSKELLEASSLSTCYIDASPVLANGRIELLHYLREVSISSDYHRYGNLGLRENEIRKPIR
ncbi:MAG: 1-pyrroline-5-carboxylate dehydrogenase [Chlamydiia bacterium]|nr:1-pyrroline-5-carboxylate dehydrogenase [Chlamydiia bacterium]